MMEFVKLKIYIKRYTSKKKKKTGKLGKILKMAC